MSDHAYSPLEAALEKLTVYNVWQLLGLEGKPGKACRSPFRKDRSPSFSVYDKGQKWKDFATNEYGDAADFCARARNLSKEDGARLLIDLAGTRKPKDVAISGPHKREPYDPFKDEEKARKREGWPAFEVPTQAEIAEIATLRGLSPEGVAIAAERGLLFCADFRQARAWIISDSRRVNAQARRLDGKLWERIDAKAWTLPGSVGAWPIGLREAQDFPRIALTEGGPDALAVFHLAWCATSTPETLALGKGIDVVGKLGVVAMLGRHQIPESELRHFKGKHVRIFADADNPGLQAEGRWWHQLESAGARVDGYSFAGFFRSDEKPVEGSDEKPVVKDLCDFAHVGSDQWETHRDALEEAFTFPI